MVHLVSQSGRMLNATGSFKLSPGVDSGPPPPGASSVVSVVLEKIVVILDLLMKLNAVPGIS